MLKLEKIGVNIKSQKLFQLIAVAKKVKLHFAKIKRTSKLSNEIFKKYIEDLENNLGIYGASVLEQFYPYCAINTSNIEWASL